MTISKSQYAHLTRISSGEITHYTQEFLGGFRTPVYGVKADSTYADKTATVVTVEALENKGLLKTKQVTKIGRSHNYIGSLSLMTPAGLEAIADYESKK